MKEKMKRIEEYTKIDTWGRVITLVGTHAFEYAIHIEGVRTVTETFENGTLARKRFNELKKKP